MLSYGVEFIHIRCAFVEKFAFCFMRLSLHISIRSPILLLGAPCDEMFQNEFYVSFWMEWFGCQMEKTGQKVIFTCSAFYYNFFIHLFFHPVHMKYIHDIIARYKTETGIKAMEYEEISFMHGSQVFLIYEYWHIFTPN